MSAPQQPTKPDPAELQSLLGSVLDDPLLLDERDDAAEVVAALPSASFVRIARRLREEQRLELLLPHANADQLTCLLDLDAWHQDRLDIRRARAWLMAIAEHSARVPTRGELTELIYAMDPELWTLSLYFGTKVAILDPEDDSARDRAHQELGGMRTWDTPDGFFVVGVPDDENGRQVLHILANVYDDDLGQGRRLVLSIDSALPSEIEENLLRFRSGRLADLGFSAWEDAVKLFRPLDHRAAADQDPRDFRWLQGESLGGTLEGFRGTDLLRRAMARLSDHEHGIRAREFLLLVNEVIAAQRLPPGDEPVQERAVDQTQATLELGLELLLQTRPGHPDPETFLADRIRAIGLRDIFRVGYGALDKLRRAALALHRTMRVSYASVGSMLDRPWGPAVASLVRWYPELPLEARGQGTRPLRSLADVARGTERIAEAGALASLAYEAQGYGIDPVWIGRVDEPEKVLLGDLIRTAMIHCALPGSQARFAPLSGDDLAWAHGRMQEGEKLLDELRKDLSARCDALGIGRYTSVLADTLLTRLRVELAGLEFAENKPDLTRIAGVITVQSVSMWLTVEGSN